MPEREELLDFIEKLAVPLHWVGEDGTILWANEAELRFLGYSRDEYVGRDIRDFHVDQEVIGDILCRLLRDEELHGYIARLRCKDGSIREVAISSSAYRVDGRFVHTRCVSLDVTKERRMSEVQERLAAIVESSTDAILSKDLNGIVQSWNKGAQSIFGYTADEIVGKHISTLAVPARLDEFPNILDKIRRGERVEHYETQRRAKDGRTLSISLNVSPIRDANGTIIGASKVARDITERHSQEAALKAANAALTQANADLQQFVYSASHDLQEPLRMVSTYSAMLQKKFEGKLGEAGNEYIGYTLQGALRMQQLLQGLRTYTQASLGAEAPPSDLDASLVLDKTLGNLDAAIKESGASITHSDLPKIRLHEFQLEQLFQNLISNSIRYRSKAPIKIRVAAKRRDSEWIFSIEDNGIGIAPQFQDQIFGLFTRLHSVTEYPGTGMGLAICQRIVERAGGRIWVESEPGKGSTFFFSIPA